MFVVNSSFGWFVYGVTFLSTCTKACSGHRSPLSVRFQVPEDLEGFFHEPLNRLSEDATVLLLWMRGG